MPNQTQTPQVVGGEDLRSASLNIKDEQIRLTENNPFVSSIAQTLPQYGRLGVPHITNRLINDDEFLDQVATDLFRNSMKDPEFRSRYDNEKDPGKKQFDDFQTIRKTIRERASLASLSGQDIAEVLTDRTMQFRVPKETVSPSGELSQYYKTLTGQESGGVVDIENPDSTATGLYQFLEGTWKDLMTRHPEAGLTEDGRTDPIQSLIALDIFTKENAEALSRNRIPTNDKNLYVAHFLGPNGAVNFFKELRANPDRPVDEFISERVLEANKTVFYTDKGKGRPRTAQEYYNFHTSKFNDESTWSLSHISKSGVFTERQKPNLPLTEFRSIIEANADRYKDYGLVDSDGKVIHTNDRVGNLGLEKDILANEELMNVLFRDRFNTFSDELSKSHNLNSIVESDPNEMARAYAIYDRFGSEGLTQYINYIEGYDSTVPEEKQSRKYVDAFNFLTSYKVDGQTPAQYMNTFIRGNDKVGQLEYIPEKENFEAQVLFPAGYNNFVSDVYDFNGGQFVRKDGVEIAKSYLTRFNLDVNDDTVKEVAAGVTGSYQDLVWKVRNEVPLEELYATLMANSEYLVEDGSARYVVRGFDKAPLEVKLAIDALRTHNDQAKYIYTQGNDNFNWAARLNQINPNPAVRQASIAVMSPTTDVVFEPERLDRVQRTNIFAKALDFIGGEEYVPVVDEAGRVQSYEKRNAHHFFSPFIGLGVEAANFANKFFIEPVAELTTLQSSDMDALYQETFGDYNIALQSFRDGYDGVTGGAMFVGEMASYIAGIASYGKLAGSSLRYIAPNVGRLRNMANVAKASAIASPNISKWQAYRAGITKAFASTDRKNIGMKMLVGDMMLQTHNSNEESFFGQGSLGSKAEETYKRSNYLGRYFADSALNAGLGVLFDAALTGVVVGAKGTKGSKWNEFLAKTEPGQFNALIKESIQGMPNESLRKSAYTTVKELIDGADDLSVENIAATLKQNASPLLTTLKSDIRETLKYYDELAGVGARPNLDESVDTIYNQAIDQAAGFVTGLFKTGDDPVSLNKLSTFISKLENQNTVVREAVETQGKVLSYQEAVDVVANGTNRIIKPVDSVVGEDGVERAYKVYEVDSDEWLTDLTSVIRKKAINFEIDDLIKHKEAELGKSLNLTQRNDLTQRASDVYNTPIKTKIDDKEVEGFIIDIDEGVATVRDYEGNIYKTKDYSDAMFENIESKRINNLISEDEYESLMDRYVREPSEQEIKEVQQEVANKVEASSKPKKTVGPKEEPEAPKETIVSDKDIENLRKNGRIRDNVLEKIAKKIATTDENVKLTQYESEVAVIKASEIAEKVKKYRKGEPVKQPTPEEAVAKQEEVIVKKNEEVKASAKKKAAETYIEVKDSEPPVKPIGHTRETQTGLRQKTLDGIKRIKNGIPTREEIGTYVRKLGTDGADFFNQRLKKGVLILGDNQGAIKKYEDVGEIPKDIVVKTRGDKGETSYFVSNKKTLMPPSRWVKTTDGKVVKNPDWDQVDPNYFVSDSGVLKTFVKDPETGFYRAVTHGDGTSPENIVYLNVQKPVQSKKGSASVSEIGDDVIVNNGYDAVIHKIKGKEYIELVDEGSQAVGITRVLENNVTKGVKPNKAKAKVKTKAEPEKVIHEEPKIKKAKATNQIKKEIKKVKDDGIKLDKDDLINLDIPGYLVGLGLGGYVLDGLIDMFSDGIYDDEEIQEAGIGSKVLGKMFKSLGGQVKKRIADLATEGETVIEKAVPISAKKTAGIRPGDEVALDLSDKIYKAGEARAAGMVSDPRNVEETNAYMGWWNSFKEILRAGKGDGAEIARKVRKNRYVESPFNFLASLSDTAKDLRDVIFNYEHHGRLLIADYKINFNKKFPNVINAWDQFYEASNAKVLPKLQELGLTEAKEKDAYHEWNEGIWRIINGGVKLADGGGITFNANKQNVSAAYEGALGEARKKIDEFILSDDDFKTFISSIREVNARVKKEWIGELDKAIKEETFKLYKSPVLLPRQIELLGEFVNTKRGLRAYVSELDTKDTTMFMDLVKNRNSLPVVDKLLNLRRIKNSFTDIGDDYLPQMYSREKTQMILNKRINKHMSGGATKTEAEKLAQNEMFEDFYQANKNTKRGKNLWKYTEEGQLEEPRFKTKKGALQELERIFQNNQDIADKFANLNRNNLIEERPYFDNTGKQHGVRYYLNLPEEIAERTNRTAYHSLFNDFMLGTVVRNSNFLERPRKYELPYQWAETDIDKLIYRYSQDTGPRLAMVKKGIWTKEDLETKYLSKIKAELDAKGVDEITAAGHLERVENIFNTQTGVMHNIFSIAEPEKRLAALDKQISFEKFSSAYRNFNFATIGFGISFLDTFQPFVMGPLLSSWKSVRNTTKLFATNKQAMENVEEISRLFHLTTRKVETFRPQQEFDFGDVVSFSGTGHRLGQLQRGTNWMAETVASLSFGKAFVSVLNEFTGNALQLSLDDLGFAKLAINDFHGINSVSTSMNWFAGVYEAEKLAGMLKTLLDNPERSVVEGLTREDIYKRFIDIGIEEERIPQFVKNIEDFNKLTGSIASDKKLDYNMLTENQELYYDLQSIANTMTDRYHGKNKMFRPESWSSGYGRLFSQFMVYPFNFALQNSQNTVVKPITGYINALKSGEFGGNIDKMGNFEIMSMVRHIATNNRKALYKKGFTDAAIDAFPVAPFYQVSKLVMATNIAAGSFMTRDAVYDLVSYPINDMTEQEQWKRINARKYVNPYDKESRRITWEELANGAGMELGDYIEGIRAYVGYASDLGTFGLVPNILFSPFGARDGILTNSITLSKVNDFYKSVNRITTSHIEDMPETASKEMVDQGLKNAPFFGYYRRTLKDASDAILFQEESKGTTIVDQTGERYRPSAFDIYP